VEREDEKRMEMRNHRIVRIFQEPEKQKLILPGALVYPAGGLRLSGMVVGTSRDGKRIAVRWHGLNTGNTCMYRPSDLILVENPSDDEDSAEEEGDDEQ
jgi:hypothetical protein